MPTNDKETPSSIIIHIDLDAFFCAVEALLNPDLIGKPFAVGGKNNRGVVTSASYAARKFGVRSAMPMSRALHLCPALIAVSSTRSAYSEKSKEVMKVIREFTDIVEQISIDEAFLDVSKHSNIKPIDLAKQIQGKIYKKTGLPSSLGVATNKLTAKIANDVGKASTKTNSYPMAIKIIEPGMEREFLSLLPVEMLWGIGPKTALKLENLGMHTIGDIADWPVNDLMRRFGQQGYGMSLKAKGIDNRHLNTKRNSKSISQENTFFDDIVDENKLLKTLQRHSNKIEKRLIKSKKKGSTIKIKVRWADFSTITRQTTLESPTDSAKIIYSTAREIFFANWKKGRPVRLLGVGISNFEAETSQLILWDANDNIKQTKLQDAINEINEKYGDNKIIKGPASQV